MTRNSALPSAARATQAPKHSKGTLAATILGSSLAFIDGSVVNVALPAIERDLASSGASGASIGWLINAYLLPLGALVLVGGVAGDRYGRTRMFLAGIAVFTAASLGCALAPGFAWLLAARALQGVGAALLVPASLAIIGSAFEGEARDSGRDVGATSAVAGALGPSPAAGLSTRSAIFSSTRPIAAAAAAPRRQVDESRSDDAAPLTVGAARNGRSGFATFAHRAAAHGAAHGGVPPRRRPGRRSRRPGHRVRRSAHRWRAMMPPALFGTRPFVGDLLTLAYALSGMVVLLPYLLIASAGWAATAAGAALLPLSLVMGLGSRAAGKLAERVGTRRLLTVGPIVVAVGLALFVRVGAGAVHYATDVLPGLLLVACGLTLSVAPLTAAVIAAVDPSHVGSASGVNNATARVAGLLATALLGYVLAGDMTERAFVGRFHGAAIVGAVLALAAAASAYFLCAPISGSRGRRAPAPPAAP
jgi:MFS family permease